jgi:hypothetical protein
MKPDFTVLDAYYDLWQQLAQQMPLDEGFVDALILLPQYQGALRKYQDVLQLAPEDLARTLKSLGDLSAAPPLPHLALAQFWQANQQAIEQIGQRFDIIFPLRRLQLEHSTARLKRQGRELPGYLRIMPDLLPQPYLVEDALVLNFFQIRIDPSGHLVIDNQPLAEYAAAWLEREM